MKKIHKRFIASGNKCYYCGSTNTSFDYIYKRWFCNSCYTYF